MVFLQKRFKYKIRWPISSKMYTVHAKVACSKIEAQSKIQLGPCYVNSHTYTLSKIIEEKNPKTSSNDLKCEVILICTHTNIHMYGICLKIGKMDSGNVKM